MAEEVITTAPSETQTTTTVAEENTAAGQDAQTNVQETTDGNGTVENNNTERQKKIGAKCPHLSFILLHPAYSL